MPLICINYRWKVSCLYVKISLMNRFCSQMYILLAGLMYFTCVSCATYNGREQFIKVSSDIDTAKVYYKNQFLGYTQSFIPLSRGHSKTLMVLGNNDKKELYLKSNYRWTDSFLNNMALSMVNPILGISGVIVDLYSGSAWEYENPKMVRFLDHENLAPLAPRKIAIAPTIYNSSVAAEEANNHLEILAKSRYLNSKFLSKERAVALYEDYGYSNLNEVKKQFENDLYRELGVTHILKSKLLSNQSTAILEVKLVDIYRDKVVDNFNAVTDRKNLNYINQSFQGFLKEKFIDSLPNSLGVSYLAYQSPLSAFSECPVTDQRCEYVFELEKDLNLLSKSITLSYSNIESKKALSFGFKFKFISSVDLLFESLGLKYKNSNALDYQKLDDKFQHIAMSGSIGPEIGFYTSDLYFYGNYRPTVSYNFLNNLSKPTAQRYQLSYLDSFDLGALILGGDRWSLRAFSKIVIYPNDYFKEPLVDSLGQEIYDQTTVRYNFGISIEYFLPETKADFQKLIF